MNQSDEIAAVADVIDAHLPGDYTHLFFADPGATEPKVRCRCGWRGRSRHSEHVAEQVLRTPPDCPNEHGPDGVIKCWSPGGPCEVPNDPACETCGRCFICTDRPSPPGLRERAEAHGCDVEDENTGRLLACRNCTSSPGPVQP